MATVEVNDRVKYSRNFLRSIGAVASEEGMAHVEGTVTKITKFPNSSCPAVAKVLWDGEDEPRGSLVKNLTVKGKPEVE